MLEDRSTIYAKVARERIADVNWIMEGYEHLALVSTIDHQEGIILLRGTPDTYNDVLEIVENMPYLYIYTGNGDELEEMIFESTEMLYELLEESFYPYDRMNEVILFENAHNEKSWREIFPDFLHTFLSRL